LQKAAENIVIRNVQSYQTAVLIAPADPALNSVAGPGVGDCDDRQAANFLALTLLFNINHWHWGNNSLTAPLVTGPVLTLAASAFYANSPPADAWIPSPGEVTNFTPCRLNTNQNCRHEPQRKMAFGFTFGCREIEHRKHLSHVNQKLQSATNSLF